MADMFEAVAIRTEDFASNSRKKAITRREV